MGQSTSDSVHFPVLLTADEKTSFEPKASKLTSGQLLVNKGSGAYRAHLHLFHLACLDKSLGLHKRSARPRFLM